MLTGLEQRLNWLKCQLTNYSFRKREGRGHMLWVIREKAGDILCCEWLASYPGLPFPTFTFWSLAVCIKNWRLGRKLVKDVNSLICSFWSFVLEPKNCSSNTSSSFITPVVSTYVRVQRCMWDRERWEMEERRCEERGRRGGGGVHMPGVTQE